MYKLCFVWINVNRRIVKLKVLVIIYVINRCRIVYIIYVVILMIRDEVLFNRRKNRDYG